jgi:hypothetical protein
VLWRLALSVIIAAACSKKVATEDAGPDTGQTGDGASADRGDAQVDEPSIPEPNPDASLDGPSGDASSRRAEFTSWTSCGWEGGPCLCDGIRACAPVAGGAYLPFGSQQARVCAIDGDVCEYVVFSETEGGGTARRCRVPLDAGTCVAGFGNTSDPRCVDLFTCNLLMGNCPPDVMPSVSVIFCR